MSREQVVEELEKKLEEGLAWAKEAGYAICSGTYYGEVSKAEACCPIAACIIKNGIYKEIRYYSLAYPWAQVAEALLKLPRQDIDSFTWGFDGKEPNTLITEGNDLYTLGKRLRAKYITQEKADDQEEDRDP